jgi:hypothetical protein
MTTETQAHSSFEGFRSIAARGTPEEPARSLSRSRGSFGSTDSTRRPSPARDPKGALATTPSLTSEHGSLHQTDPTLGDDAEKPHTEPFLGWAIGSSRARRLSRETELRSARPIQGSAAFRAVLFSPGSAPMRALAPALASEVSGDAEAIQTCVAKVESPDP